MMRVLRKPEFGSIGRTYLQDRLLEWQQGQFAEE